MGGCGSPILCLSAGPARGWVGGGGERWAVLWEVGEDSAQRGGRDEVAGGSQSRTIQHSGS